MKAFIFHHMSNGEELRAKLKQAESDLATTEKVVVEGARTLKLAKGKKKVIRIDADKLRKEGKIVKVKLKEIEQENVELKKEMEELRAEFVAQKNEVEELHTRFAAQNNELETEYQKQVDKMYFFD